MGGYRLRILSAFPGVEVAGVVECDEARRQELLRAHPATAGYGDLEEALAEQQFDFACLAVPVAALPECASAVLAAGVHAFVEKPMAPSEDHARELPVRPTSAGLCSESVSSSGSTPPWSR